MSDIDRFVSHLNQVAANLDQFIDPLLEDFAAQVAKQVSKEAPKRTRRRPGGTLRQVEPGVLELSRGELVGEVRTLPQSSPKSRTFASDALKDVQRPLGRAVINTTVSRMKP